MRADPAMSTVDKSRDSSRRWNPERSRGSIGEGTQGNKQLQVVMEYCIMESNLRRINVFIHWFRSHHGYWLALKSGSFDGEDGRFGLTKRSCGQRDCLTRASEITPVDLGRCVSFEPAIHSARAVPFLGWQTQSSVQSVECIPCILDKKWRQIRDLSVWYKLCQFFLRADIFFVL